MEKNIHLFPFSDFVVHIFTPHPRKISFEGSPDMDVQNQLATISNLPPAIMKAAKNYHLTPEQAENLADAIKTSGIHPPYAIALLKTLSAKILTCALNLKSENWEDDNAPSILTIAKAMEETGYPLENPDQLDTDTVIHAIQGYTFSKEYAYFERNPVSGDFERRTYSRATSNNSTYSWQNDKRYIYTETDVEDDYDNESTP
jgi:hypothetical protein